MDSFRQLAALLRTRIADGTYPPGSQLSSAADLCHESGLGRDAVIDAIDDLANEGLVTTRRGYRTLVRLLPERETLHLSPGVQVVARMPTPAERDRLELASGVPVLEVRQGGEVTVYAGDKWGIET